MADTKLLDVASRIGAIDIKADRTYIADASSASTDYYALLDQLIALRPSIFEARLTTESGVGVSTSDRTAQSTIYLMPFGGAMICLYDGTIWKAYVLAEISLALSGLTSGKNYDVFVYDNAGTLTLELSAAWTDDSTRADALTLQNSIKVKSGATTRRYVGTIRTTGTTTTEDSERKRLVYNEYNQVLRRNYYSEATSHTYDSATARSWNDDPTTQVEVVLGSAQTVTYICTPQIQCAATPGSPAVYGIWDWTSSVLIDATVGYVSASTAVSLIAGDSNYKPLAAGWHYLRGVQAEFAAVASTFDRIVLKAGAFL